jgi:uncharacterized protein DUF5995
MTLPDILNRRPARTIDDVVSMMTDIANALPDDDGLKWFNHLYMQVTLGVRAVVGDGKAFRDPSFLSTLDVVFGNLFFDAVAAGQDDPAKAPPAWRPLLQSRHTRGIKRLQLALAGINAHINRDLPVALVKSYEAMGGSPSLTDPRHADYEQVNAILEEVESRVKADFLTGVLRDVDAVAGPLGDRVATFDIRVARDAAWTHFQVLWSLRGTPPLYAAFLDSLDRLTGFAGRGLIVRV